MRLNRLATWVLCCIALSFGRHAPAHEPTPDPMLSYSFAKQHVSTDDAGRPTLSPQFGPTVMLGGKPLQEDEAIVGLRFAGLEECHQVTAESEEARSLLPHRDSRSLPG